MAYETVLEVRAEPRYWEDATVCGDEDADGSLIPFREGDLWCPIIDLESGKVIDWPNGVTADIHYKVCDQGEYWLRDANGARVAKWRSHYVPDRFLCHGDAGYGDYIIMTVETDGRILNWTHPEIHPEEWISLQEPSHDNP